MTELDYAAMAKQLRVLFDEKEYEAFLRGQSLTKDHSFLLAAIKRSNLRPAVRNVVEELIRFGKIRRAKHRPRSADNYLKGLQRALCVLDIEAEGCDKRDAAIEEARKKLNLSYSTVEKAVHKYEGEIKNIEANQPDFLDQLRTAFK
jgi:hypothetical protein